MQFSYCAGAARNITINNDIVRRRNLRFVWTVRVVRISYGDRDTEQQIEHCFCRFAANCGVRGFRNQRHLVERWYSGIWGNIYFIINRIISFGICISQIPYQTFWIRVNIRIYAAVSGRLKINITLSVSERPWINIQFVCRIGFYIRIAIGNRRNAPCCYICFSVKRNIGISLVSRVLSGFYVFVADINSRIYCFTVIVDFCMPRGDRNRTCSVNINLFGHIDLILCCYGNIFICSGLIAIQCGCCIMYYRSF